jgi:hypothetical protein
MVIVPAMAVVGRDLMEHPHGAEGQSASAPRRALWTALPAASPIACGLALVPATFTVMWLVMLPVVTVAVGACAGAAAAGASVAQRHAPLHPFRNHLPRRTAPPRRSRRLLANSRFIGVSIWGKPCSGPRPAGRENPSRSRRPATIWRRVSASPGRHA